ncbi:MAG TPA: glutathione S-transferase N-terminal domain-containing protein [Candidatus Binatia bacterium]|nr:glutathione S-transferase N-terminal domain-containing protein [Candidatus Binatia bacterium]
MRAFDVATSFAASIARAGTGMQVGTLGARPAKPLELYEFEACPYCRKAREALSILDLDARIFPCPQGGPTFRRAMRQKGGKEQFPYLVDPNTGAEMYESDEIVRYLFARYGDGNVPWSLSLPIATDLTSGLASAWRVIAGRSYRTAKMPAQPLELWSFEASPYSRLVRERLCELELPYLLHNVARGSTKRHDFVARSGRMMVPYLHDPNTGSEMFESADICAYLELTYAR